MKRKLLIVDSLHPAAVEILERHQDELSWEILPAEDFSKKIPEASFAIVRSTSPVTTELLKKAAKLKLIVRAGVGTDAIDLAAAEEKHIQVETTQEANAVSTAELTIGLLLNLIRKLPAAETKVRAGNWIDSKFRNQFRGSEIGGKKIGIVGLGRVGSRVALRLKAFEANVIACDPYLSSKEAQGFPLVKFQEILETADIISFHVPLTKETQGMLSAQAIASTKRKPFIVNTSRGEVVDQTALITGLETEKISGYAADVFDQEPLPSHSPLLKLKNVVLSPHLGAQTEEAQRRVGITAVQKIIEFIHNPKGNSK